MSGVRIVLPRKTEPRLIAREGAPPAGSRIKTFGTVGPQGQPGPATAVPDPGDLTLIFDNRLV